MDKGKAEERRKRKTYYAKLRKDEDDKMAELAAKYRDRASERRSGAEGGVVGEESTNAYRAVAPNARETHDAAERRRQMIHESKYLGGDMEHSHLVKGLDFALLQKIEAREQMEQEEAEEEEVKEKEMEKKGDSECITPSSRHVSICPAAPRRRTKLFSTPSKGRQGTSCPPAPGRRSLFPRVTE